MITLPTPRLLAPALAATAGLLIMLPSTAIAQPGPTLAIDVGPQDNAGAALGPLEDCVMAEVGDVFQIDVVIEDVTDLLAWELSVEFDPEVVSVVDHDVRLFQEADGVSAVIDVSQQLPDEPGFYTLSAFESSDPPAVDRGSGVLARLTLEALAEGDSDLEFGTRDFGGEGDLDRGTLLRAFDGGAIGDENDDDFFDGEADGAQVFVGSECPPGTTAVQAQVVEIDNGDDNNGADDDSSSFPWAIAGGAAGGLAVLLAAAVLLLRRRGGAPATPEPPTGT